MPISLYYAKNIMVNEMNIKNYKDKTTKEEKEIDLEFMFPKSVLDIDG